MNYLFPLFLLIGLTACTNSREPVIQIRTDIVIEASPAEVFEVLADFKRYPQWNPYHRSVQGEFVEGAPLNIHIQRPDGEEIEVPPHMQSIVTDREISWGGGVKGVFYGEHRFVLTPSSNGATHLQHDEDFWGVVVQFTNISHAVLTEGYEGMNRALKVYVESRESGHEFTQ
jgi:hypothetical protein